MHLVSVNYLTLAQHPPYVQLILRGQNKSADTKEQLVCAPSPRRDSTDLATAKLTDQTGQRHSFLIPCPCPLFLRCHQARCHLSTNRKYVSSCHPGPDLSYYVALPVADCSSELIPDPTRINLPPITPFQALWPILSFQAQPQTSVFYSKFNLSHQVPAEGFLAESPIIMSLPHAVYSWSITTVTPEHSSKNL